MEPAGQSIVFEHPTGWEDVQKLANALLHASHVAAAKGTLRGGPFWKLPSLPRYWQKVPQSAPLLVVCHLRPDVPDSTSASACEPCHSCQKVFEQSLQTRCARFYIKISIMREGLQRALATVASPRRTLAQLLPQWLLRGGGHGGGLGPKASRTGADAGGAGSQAGTRGLHAGDDGCGGGSQGAADGAGTRQAVSHQLRGMLELVRPAIAGAACVAQYGLADWPSSPLRGLFHAAVLAGAANFGEL